MAIIFVWVPGRRYAGRPGGGWHSAPADMRCAARRGNCPMNTDDAPGFRLIMKE